MKTRKYFLLPLLGVLASAAAAQAFTWHVDANGFPGAGGTGPADALPSLQEAIDRAGDGDVILVAEGEYGPVSVSSPRSLSIRSTDGAENTILAGDGQTRCATFADETGAASWNVTLEGFTLEGGVDVSDDGGGGVFGGNLVNCILRGNSAVRGGAASGSRLENCLLSGNAAALVGGGAYDSELVNCTVAGNRADATGGGACGCTLANSIVQGNDSPDGADAVGCFAAYSCTTPLLEGEGNTDADACFADPDADDWRLAKGSPCLDAGDDGFCTSATDLVGNGRVAGTGIDLGACEGAAGTPAKTRGVSTIAGHAVTISFDANGGTSSLATKKFRIGTKYSGLPTASRSGYLFNGWHTAAQGGTRISGNPDIVVSASHKKLYAHWLPAVTVTFDANGGTCNPGKKTYRVGVKYPGFPRPTRAGYLYTGWYTAAKDGTRITTNTTVTASRKKLYAHWVPAVTVAFDANGGTCSPNKKTFRVGAKYSGLPRPTRPGYLYTGWFTASKGGTRISANTVVTASRKKIYAQWLPAVTVAFDANGGKCSPAKIMYRIGWKYSPLPTPTRSGYLFTGWYTAAKDGTRITTNTVASASYKKFFAQWRKAVTVSFDPNGGTCTVKKKKYGLGLTYSSLPVPTRSNHTFTGWYTPAGVHVKTSSTVTSTRTNLVAHWYKNLSLHPVGDSMTYGVRTRNNPLLRNVSPSDVAQIHNQGWRGYLNQTLAAWGKTQNRTIVFLGKHPESAWKGNIPHDGYGGEPASTYARNHADACAVQADVQIVFLGMNDALALSRKDDPGRYFGSVRDGYDKVLSALHAGSTTPMAVLITEPAVTSLVTKHNSSYKADAINNVIVHYINPYVRAKKASKVKILDIESLYRNSSRTDDGFHLSIEGNKVLASDLADLIESFWQGK